MSRNRILTAIIGALLLVALATGCEDDGKTAPARCADPALPRFDIHTAGAPADDNAYLNDDEDAQGNPLPCVTEVGHAISGNTEPVGSGGSSAAGASDAGAGGS